MWAGFKSFLMRGNVIEAAVAFVTNVINPLVAAAGGKQGIGLGWHINGDQPSHFLNIGGFISAVIYFVIFMAVVYFLIVTPYKVFQERRGRTAFADPPPVKTCPACLSADLPVEASKCKYCGTEQPAAA